MFEPFDPPTQNTISIYIQFFNYVYMNYTMTTNSMSKIIWLQVTLGKVVEDTKTDVK